ncbi:squalene synthase HpnC [Methylocystis bryophila]|uniref:Squalene synthase HpnC n=1 Tax=Methylocystis bryophila TaxID=655015 RepID=A0A1W6MRZ2_9HYPH|nr:squalene synthase HpnC [Methylocystis bryophila]ARN80364.1 squalene synthase HpnC [Methylocystis bryophila]BDV40357.1 squalene synthase HpnC [Methylocystis bryophila]
MTSANTIEIAQTASGKTHRDENFPVASVLIAPRFRAPILAFYNFVRAADDISDHASLTPQEKLALLDRLEAALLGRGPDEEPARALREELDRRSLSPQHACDLVTAFRRDVTQLRYRDWDDLIDYCRYSAMPVGRFVLDAHGEDAAATWPANDALCAALQIINHLQDCGKDYRNLDRVYLPQDTLSECGASVETLGEAKAPAPLRSALQRLASRTDDLLKEARPFADRIQNLRLAMEVGAIQNLAEKLTDRLLVADPLSEKVHAGKSAFLLASARGAALVVLRRLMRGKLGVLS